MLLARSTGAGVPRTWNALILGVALALGIVVPLQVVSDPSGQVLSGVVEAALTVLFAVDLGARLRADRSKPKWRRTAWLVLDALAALPLAPWLGAPAALFRLAKLARLVPLAGQAPHTITVHPTLLRLGVFAFVLTISAHWIACGWLWLGGPTSVSGASPYLGALYWCVTTLSTVGYGDVTPETASQTIYAMTVVMLGVALYGFVIGNVATLLTRVDLARSQYLATLDRLTGFLRYHRVPADLQRHVFDYYEYLWQRRMGYDEKALLDDLPPSLRQELSMVLKGDLIGKLSFLEGASRELVQDLCRELDPVVFTPGDVIVRTGDPGRHVYFISSGTVEVVDEHGVFVRTLSDGDIFGELALLHDRPRSATVRAIEYCDLYTLDRDAFKRAVARYPHFSEHIAKLEAERPELGDPSS